MPFKFVSGTVLGAVSLLILWSTAVQANIVPAPLFSDNVVLQRDQNIPVYGTADPLEPVTVSLDGKTVSCVSDQEGRWRVELPPMKSGGPYQLIISGKNVIKVSNVLIGDVWVCSGQSNMTFEIAWFDRNYYAKDIATANDSGIREFNDSDDGSLTQRDEANGNWTVCTPDTVINFSTVAYFFARTLRESMPDVPIGIIHSSVGGTAAEPWTPLDFLQKDPVLAANANSQIAALNALPDAKEQFPIALSAWEKANGALDSGNSGFAAGWAAPSTDVSDWKKIEIPTNFGVLGLKAGGVVWYRKDVVFSPAAADKDFDLQLNWNDSIFQVYLNGNLLKENNPPDPFYPAPRSFHVPSSLIKAGQLNTVAIREYSLTNGGYLWLPTKDLGLPAADPGTLDNSWQFNVEQNFPEISSAASTSLPKPPGASMNATSTTLYNGKIAPLIPYAIKGVLWYQGESNAGNAKEYYTILPLLIDGWRAHWGEGNFPFYIVQLANYGTVPVQPVDSGWARIREAQLFTAENVPNSGLVVTIDTAKRDEIIHPLDKQDVGYRAGLVALARTYQKHIEYCGPIYKSILIDGNTVRVVFNHADGLYAKGGPLQQFAIAGADQKFVWANAIIDGNGVDVSSPLVPNPVAVRYAWSDNPFGCNLYNSANLPASPFRTDDWN